MAEEERTPGQVPSGRAWDIALAAVGLLLFTWPFVREPPLGLLGSYVHLLAAWTAVIAASWAVARAGARRDRLDG